MDKLLEQFVHEANLERYEALLKTCSGGAQRRQLETLLNEERAASVHGAAAERSGHADPGESRR